MFCRSLHLLTAKLTSLPATFSSLSRLVDLALLVHPQVDLSSINCLTGLTSLCLELQDHTHLPDLDLSRHALRELQLFWAGREQLEESIPNIDFDPTHVSPRAHPRSIYT